MYSNIPARTKSNILYYFSQHHSRLNKGFTKSTTFLSQKPPAGGDPPTESCDLLSACVFIKVRLIRIAICMSRPGCFDVCLREQIVFSQRYVPAHAASRWAWPDLQILFYFFCQRKKKRIMNVDQLSKKKKNVRMLSVSETMPWVFVVTFHRWALWLVSMLEFTVFNFYPQECNFFPFVWLVDLLTSGILDFCRSLLSRVWVLPPLWAITAYWQFVLPAVVTAALGRSWMQINK